MTENENYNVNQKVAFHNNNKNTQHTQKYTTYTLSLIFPQACFFHFPVTPHLTKSNKLLNLDIVS